MPNIWPATRKAFRQNKVPAGMWNIRRTISSANGRLARLARTANTSNQSSGLIKRTISIHIPKNSSDSKDIFCTARIPVEQDPAQGNKDERKADRYGPDSF